MPAAAIAVMDQAGRWLPRADGVLQGFEDERLGHLLGKAPADDRREPRSSTKAR